VNTLTTRALVILRSVGAKVKRSPKRGDASQAAAEVREATGQSGPGQAHAKDPEASAHGRVDGQAEVLTPVRSPFDARREEPLSRDTLEWLETRSMRPRTEAFEKAMVLPIKE
jgi:hypothetical protein